jgi:AraC-like DNA-binding protein
MLTGPTALTMTVAPLEDALRGSAVDFRELARLAGIDLGLLGRSDARYPSTRIHRLWALAAEATADPLLGLRAGSLARPGTFHALGLGIVSSGSVLEALRRIVRYSGVVSTNGRFVLIEEDGHVTLEARPTVMTVRPAPHWLDALVVALGRMLALCAGPSATPVRVLLPHAGREHADAYRKALHCPVEFEAGRVALVFDAGLAAQPVRTGHPELAAEADRIAARYLEGLEPGTVATRVRALLLEAMPSGELDQECIARALHQSPSTLQRRLRREGTTYQNLLDATRREMALQYLREGRHSLADVAFLLGFADQSNFTRAFRRWTGKTPRQFLS